MCCLPETTRGRRDGEIRTLMGKKRVIPTPPVPETAPVAPQSRASWEWPAATGVLTYFVLFGFVLQAKFGAPSGLFAWIVAQIGGTPQAAIWLSWSLAAAGLLLAVGLGIGLRSTDTLRFLSGVPLAVAATVAVTVLALFGTIIVQSPEITDSWQARIGLHAMFKSWPFVLTVLLMLLNLATVLGRRLVQPRPGNLGFILNHLGVIVVFLAAMAGSIQVKNLYMRLSQGAETQELRTDENQVMELLGTKLTLNRFQVEYYHPPHLAVQGVDMHGHMGELINRDAAPVAAGHHYTFQNLKAHVVEYLPTAVQTANGTWKADPAGVPVVHVHAGLEGDKSYDTWISTPQPLHPPDANWALVLNFDEAMPRAFRSFLTVQEPNKAPYDFVLEVNKPLQVPGWTLYQASFGPDDQVTPAQYYSLLHCVHDPSLPLVYFGFVLMVFGAFFALWSKRALSPETTS
jgi:uncharacterized membrane protein